MSESNNTQDDEMNCGLTIDERSFLAHELRRLPDTVPPRAVWERIESQAKAEGLIGPAAPNHRTRWLAGSGIAAAVVLAVLSWPVARDPGPVATTASGDEPLPTVPAYNPNSDAELYDPVNALMVQSQLLERDLRSLPGQPEVARAGTLATIEDLQDRIAAIDYELMDRQGRMNRDELESYWRERVRLMDSLVRLRYAQVQRGSF